MADVKNPADKAETTVVKTQADIALENQQKLNKERLDKDDVRRLRDGKVSMICVTPFSLVDDPQRPEGRVVQVGEELQVADSDVHAFTGRCRLKGDPGAADEVLSGPQVQRG
jgi:hypothetical protein